MTIDEKANDIRHMFEARLITRKEYGKLIRELETNHKLIQDHDIGILHGRKRLKAREVPTTIKLEGLNEAMADFPLFTLMGQLPVIVVAE